MLRFFQKIRSLQPVLLGRWCRTDKKLSDVKVDLANIDHCGTCVHEKIKGDKLLEGPNRNLTELLKYRRPVADFK